MSGTDRSGASGCFRYLGIGCAVLVVLVAVGMVLLALNYDRIWDSQLGSSMLEGFRHARDSIGPLMVLQGELKDTFQTESVQVQLHHGRDGGPTLTVQISGARFPPGAPEDQEERARLVALRCRETCRKIGGIEQIRVDFRKGPGRGIQIQIARGYLFDLAELEEPAESNTAIPPTVIP